MTLEIEYTLLLADEAGMRGKSLTPGTSSAAAGLGSAGVYLTALRVLGQSQILQRRHIRIEQIKYIGKESNSLEAVESGLVHSAQSVYTEYPDPLRDEWETKIRPALKKVPLARLVKVSGKSRMMLINARVGHTRPHRKNQELLASIVRKLGII